MEQGERPRGEHRGLVSLRVEPHPVGRKPAGVKRRQQQCRVTGGVGPLHDTGAPADRQIADRGDVYGREGDAEHHQADLVERLWIGAGQGLGAQPPQELAPGCGDDPGHGVAGARRSKIRKQPRPARRHVTQRRGQDFRPG